MSTIDDLQERVNSLEEQLRTAKSNLERARIDASPVKVGDVVVCDGNKQRKVSRMTATWGSAHLYGYKKKANGEWGQRESYIGIVAGSGSSYGWKVQP